MLAFTLASRPSHTFACGTEILGMEDTMQAPLVLPAPRSLKEEAPLPPRPERNPFQPLLDIAIAIGTAVSMAYVLPFQRHETRDNDRERDY
jgi:hypothetical protein